MPQSFGNENPGLIVGEDVQQLSDWGVTISPPDWDGNLMLRDPQKTAQLCQRLNVTAVRILVGGISAYDNQRKIAQRRTVEWVIAPQVRALADAGITRYVLSFLTAPPALKMMYSYQPYVDGIANRLRPGADTAMANYVVDVIQILKGANLPLPYAVGIQTDPGRSGADYGCPPTLAQGTPYTYNDWATLVREVRARLDAALLTKVGIIGPESSDYAWQKQLQADPIFLSDRSPLTEISFLGSVTGSPLKGARKGGIDSKVWMLASDPTRARNEDERLVATFEDMCHDLADSDVSHWFFRYLYGPDPTSEVLVFGRDQPETELFQALANLWTWIKPPAQISLCRVENKGEQISGIRFRDNKGHVALLMIQPDLAKPTVSVAQDIMRIQRAITYTHKGSRTLSLDETDAVSAIKVEPGITLVFGFDR